MTIDQLIAKTKNGVPYLATTNKGTMLLVYKEGNILTTVEHTKDGKYLYSGYYIEERKCFRDKKVHVPLRYRILLNRLEREMRSKMND